jgi:hypothetical protein
LKGRGKDAVLKNTAIFRKDTQQVLKPLLSIVSGLIPIIEHRSNSKPTCWKYYKPVND